jgi:hypothetical protein
MTALSMARQRHNHRAASLLVENGADADRRLPGTH